MEKDNKVVLGAVLILLVGMLSFNFAGSLTGKATARGGPDVVLTAVDAQDGDTKLVFPPEDSWQASSTKTVTLTVNVNEGKINEQIYLFGPGGREEIDLCTGSYCTGTITKTYKFSEAKQEGEYYFRAQKFKSTETFKSNTITVVKEKAAYRG